MGKKEEVTALNFDYQRTPTRCPICCGKGTVMAGFYDHHSEAWAWGGTVDPTPENCKGCGGGGIVWG